MDSDRTLRNQSLLANLRDILERRGMTQRDFARLVGKNEAEISRWFSGKFNISRNSQLLIETALGEPISSDSTFRISSGDVLIGIIGTGNMAERFVRESYSATGVRVLAAYDIDETKAQQFCSANGIAKCCRSAEELISNVDAVYVSSHIDTHYLYTRMSLENNRHVLCEMPFTYTRAEADELLKLAAHRNLVLMPALKTAYCPSFGQMVNVAKTGIIGDIVDVTATVTNLLDESAPVDFANERMVENTSYPLLAFFKLLGMDAMRIYPFVRRKGNRILFTSTTIQYSGAVGCMKVGVGVKSEGSLVVSGTRGYIYVPAPWWKPDYFEVRFENPADNKKYFFPYESAGLRYEIEVWKNRIGRQDTFEYVRREEILRMTEICNRIFNNRQ